MQKINISHSPDNVSRLILGCMRMPSLQNKEAAADKVDLTHEEWYRLYLSSGKFLP